MGLLQLVTHSLNFIIVCGAEGGSEGVFDILEAQCAERKKQRGSWDGGAAITAQAHQRNPQQMSLNKMAARSA